MPQRVTAATPPPPRTSQEMVSLERYSSAGLSPASMARRTPRSVCLVTTCRRKCGGPARSRRGPGRDVRGRSRHCRPGRLRRARASIGRLVELLRRERYLPAELGAHLLRDLDSVRLAIAAGTRDRMAAARAARLVRVPTPLSTGKVATLSMPSTPSRCAATTVRTLCIGAVRFSAPRYERARCGAA